MTLPHWAAKFRNRTHLSARLKETAMTIQRRWMLRLVTEGEVSLPALPWARDDRAGLPPAAVRSDIATCPAGF